MPRRKTILVLDPCREVGELLGLILEAEGYEVITSPSLQEATEPLSNYRFDLIITEAFCQSHGFDLDPTFLTTLRSLAGNTPIVLCSTYVSSSYLRKNDFGLAEAVPKPFDFDELVQKVSWLLATEPCHR